MSAVPPRIILLGPRGSGKSSVGRLLAQQLNVEFLDLDEEVQRRTGRRIAEIFADVGDPGFREHESDALRRALASGTGVIATGGGVIVREANRELLRQTHALRIFLTAPPAILWHRVRADPHTIESRPALTRMSGEAEVSHLYSQRLPFYEQVATHTIGTSVHTPAEVVEQIMGILQRQGGV